MGCTGQIPKVMDEEQISNKAGKDEEQFSNKAGKDEE